MASSPTQPSKIIRVLGSVSWRSCCGSLHSNRKLYCAACMAVSCKQAQFSACSRSHCPACQPGSAAAASFEHQAQHILHPCSCGYWPFQLTIACVWYAHVQGSVANSGPRSMSQGWMPCAAGLLETILLASFCTSGCALLHISLAEVQLYADRCCDRTA